MSDDLVFLCHRARKLAVSLDSYQKHNEAALVTELISRLEEQNKEQAPGESMPADLVSHAQSSPDTVIIEKKVFRELFESRILFDFLIDNIGRISFGTAGDRQDPKFHFALNPPGKRQQFLRQDVLQALIEIREKLKTPQYG
jgi:hypothetical protein